MKPALVMFSLPECIALMVAHVLLDTIGVIAVPFLN